jgi:hypothetical protein
VFAIGGVWGKGPVGKVEWRVPWSCDGFFLSWAWKSERMETGLHQRINSVQWALKKAGFVCPTLPCPPVFWRLLGVSSLVRHSLCLTRPDCPFASDSPSCHPASKYTYTHMYVHIVSLLVSSALRVEAAHFSKCSLLPTSLHGASSELSSSWKP